MKLSVIEEIPKILFEVFLKKITPWQRLKSCKHKI